MATNDLGTGIFKPCAVVHTWLDMEQSEWLRRNVWKSKVRICIGVNAAYYLMKQEFTKYFEDNKASIIDAEFHHDCACLEYAEGCKEIWTLTTDCAEYPESKED